MLKRFWGSREISCQVSHHALTALAMIDNVTVTCLGFQVFEMTVPGVCIAVVQ